MPYTQRGIYGLLRTPVGRKKIRGAIRHYAWPATSRLAALNRRTFARRVPVVTVVGSFGKTTTHGCVTAALRDHIRLAEQRGGSHFAAVARTIRRLKSSDRCLVMEVGIDGKGQMLQMARVIRPDIVVVTSVGSEHNRSLGTIEGTRDEKANMVRALSSSGLAVLNGDDPNVRWMAGETDANVVTFGLGEDNDVRATDVRLDWPMGTQFLVHAGGETQAFRTRLFGRHMVYPPLAAVAVARNLGLSLAESARALESATPVPGRLHLEHGPNGAMLLCDYFKSAEETIMAALDALETIPAKRRFVVLGEVSEPKGPQGPIYRRIGERTAQVASRAILVGHSVQPYRTGAIRGGMPPSAVTDVGDDLLEAVDTLRREITSGDVILIKGRDTQRLDRIALALVGRKVGCRISVCRLRHLRCGECPLLENGWSGIPVVT